MFFFQFDQMASQATQYGNELRNTKAEIAELNRMISRLQSEIESIKAQVNNVTQLHCLRAEHSKSSIKQLINPLQLIIKIIVKKFYNKK